MASDITRKLGNYDITPESTPTDITVGETWRRISPLSRPLPTDGMLRVADKVRPYMQGAHISYTARDLATDMIREKGWSIAYCEGIPEKVLAFSMIYRYPRTIRDIATHRPNEYLLRQFGVTTTHNVMKRNPSNTPGQHYYRAAGALLYCAVAPLEADADVYVERHLGDTRRGRLFSVAGFQPYENPTNPGTYVSGAYAGEIREALQAHPDFSFLENTAE